MSSLKPLQWAGVALGIALISFALYSHLQDFSSVTFLGGILLIEVIIAGVWKYDERFFVLLMIAFLWAGMHVPLQDAWTRVRWVVLATGALAGYIVWIRAPRGRFGTFHLLAAFCVGAAFVSATISPLPRMAVFKAFSLFLLFLYCAAGARLAVLGREERFFRGLLQGTEFAVYATAICYFGLHQKIWGNPNSLGAAMGIGVFPILFWGWLTSEGPTMKFRRMAALLLCAYLIVISMARAGMVSMVLVTVVLCICLRQYKLLAKVTGIVLLAVAVAGMFAPDSLNKSLGDLKDAVLYKGHKEEGLLGSRQTPWEKSMATIKEHPWLGTGYGTSPTVEDPGLNFGMYASSAATNREHGSSYMTIAEWVGLLGGLPFLMLLSYVAATVWGVCAWMRRTSDPRHYSIPLALVVLSGLAHAGFEDWLFAVGSYPCVYFWVCAFLLADLRPAAALAPAPAGFARIAGPAPGFGTVVPNQ